MVFVFLFLTYFTLYDRLRSIHLTTNNSVSFLFMAELYSTAHIYYNFFFHPSIDGHLGCLHILVIVDNAAMNIMVHISFLISVFVFFR